MRTGMTIRYEQPSIEDLGSLVELTAGKPKFSPQYPALTTRQDGSSNSGSRSSGFSGRTTNTN